ncbi:MAG: glycosyl hydrolase family 65 protein [Ferruginibacter sp.]
MKASNYESYIGQFNKDDNEIYLEYFSNDSAWSFLKSNIPLLDCPDKNIELTYYFRWWTFRKHLKQTPDGFIISEFLPQVPWSGKYNSINCAAAQHIYEGRWLHDKKYINDYTNFWLKKGGDLRSYSFWIADAIWADYSVSNDSSLMNGLLPDLVENYKQWEIGRTLQQNFIGKNADGLFSQVDDRDGMEMSISHNGKRPTINSYMYGDAIAIAKMARLKNDLALEKNFTQKAGSIKALVLAKLWDKKDSFFKVLPNDKIQLVAVKELIGYTPWYFNMPPSGKGYEQAWRYLQLKTAFNAPYGLTTAEQSDPEFELAYTGHECQWNGPSWPFATSMTLTAMANVLNNYKQSAIVPDDYFNQLTTYAKSQRRIDSNGKVLPWIDEVLNPYTGDWISRTILEGLGWPAKIGGEERGKDYNHSTFCDLVISGLIGLRPQPGNTVIINPLVPKNTWDWFCLDNISYHGKTLTVVYDRYGKKYNKGKGLMCFVDGKLMAHSDEIGKMEFFLR